MLSSPDGDAPAPPVQTARPDAGARVGLLTAGCTSPVLLRWRTDIGTNAIPEART